MKFDPPMLTEGPLSGNVYVVTHGKIYPHPTIDGETIIEASVKYDVTNQFDALASKRSVPVEVTDETAERAWDAYCEARDAGGDEPKVVMRAALEAALR